MKRFIVIFPLALLLLIGGWTASQATASLAATLLGVTVTVNQITDDSDMNPGDGLCDVSANAGDQCSLRAAIEELNALGPDATLHHIEFDISGGGPHIIQPSSPLPPIIVPLEIDGETQPGAACPLNGSTPATLLIVLDGSNAGTGLTVDGLLLDTGSEGSIIRGLVIGNFDDEGIRIASNDNRVRCNHIGVDADGVTDFGNGGDGVAVNGDNNIIGGPLHAQRNVISANDSEGVRINSAENNTIANNFIGLTADGMSALGNLYGIYVGGNNNTIGGTAPIARNVISGNNSFGIRVNSVENNIVQGNRIGTARDGVTAVPNLSDGIQLTGAAVANVVGGVVTGEANTIAYNLGDGVKVYTNVVGIPLQNPIRGNAIFANGTLGIDLGNDGVDTNDAGDGDAGANEHQNYPLLTLPPGSMLLTGVMESQPNTVYIVDIYRSDSCDSSGYGEGQEYLGGGIITTDGTGHGEEIADLTGLVSPGDSITTIANDPNGNSSEFSACVTVTLLPTATPTPTNTATPGPSPTPTNTPTPGPSPTPTSTPIIEPTAVPGEFSIYLPVVLRPQ